MKLSKEKLINLLCKILPFIFIGTIVLYLALHTTKGDITVFCMIIPLFVLAILPLLIGIGYGVQSFMLIQSLHIPQELMMSNPQIAELSRKGSKWFRMGLFNLFTGFLIIALIAIHFAQKEEKESPYQIIKTTQLKNLREGSSLDIKLTKLDNFGHAIFKMPLVAIGIAAVFIAISFLYKKPPIVGNRLRNVAIIIPIILFAIPMITTLIVGVVIHKSVLKEVKLFFNDISPNAKVVIDGHEVSNGEEIVQALSRVGHMPAHHTVSVNHFRIEITDANQKLVLDLERDEAIHQEYWIFYPGYRYTMANEIGRIRTAIFDTYQTREDN